MTGKKTETNATTATHDKGSPEKGKDLMVAFGDQEVADAMKHVFMRQVQSVSKYRLVPQISISHQSKIPKFVLPDGKEFETLDAVIIDFCTSRECYQEGEKRPICTSIGGRYGTAFGPCTEKNCKYYKWGSGPNGNGRHCREFRKLLLVLPDFKGAFELKIPSKSLTAFDNYKNTVIGVTKFPLVAFVTRFTLSRKSEKSKNWAEVEFEKLMPITEADKALQTEVGKILVSFKDQYAPTDESDVGRTTHAEPDEEPESTPAESTDKEEDAGEDIMSTGEDGNVPF